MEPTQQNIRDLEFYLDKLQAMGICAEVRKERDRFIPTGKMEDFHILHVWKSTNPAIQHEFGSAIISRPECLVVLAKVLYSMAMGRDYSYISDDVYEANRFDKQDIEMEYNFKLKHLQSLGIIPK